MLQKLTDVVFLKVDVDKLDDIVDEYEISSMPTFVFIKNKVQVSVYIGIRVAITLLLTEIVNWHKSATNIFIKQTFKLSLHLILPY